MSILDDAIREHLELKRAHGADAAELKKLEDEAFGPPARPDEPNPFAEAPTEFLGPPEAGEAPAEETGGRRVPNIADLQEAPEPPREVEEPSAEALAEEEPSAEEEPPPPAAEEQPAMEHELPEPEPEHEHEPEHEPDASHSTEERHAIAEQPTELFDVEAEMEPAAADAPSPSDEEIVDASELSEPRLAPPANPVGDIEPPSAAPEEAAPPAEEEEPEDEFDEFFSEQRLSDELSQALDAPLTDEHKVPATDEHAALPQTDEHEAVYEDVDDEYEDDEEEDEAPATESRRDSDDVLEDTPDFLEDAPEDDELWFEQRPPKDFDFDD